MPSNEHGVQNLFCYNNLTLVKKPRYQTPLLRMSSNEHGVQNLFCYNNLTLANLRLPT
jgi:hypothetical protein